jgi:hypothetical protein
MEIILDPQIEPYVRSDAVNSVAALVHAHPQAINSEMLQTYFELLKADDDRSKRQFASYILFVVALTDTDRERVIRAELERLGDSSNPQLLIELARIQEMLTLTDLVKEARSHPTEIKQIKTKLRFVDYRYKYYPSYFDDHLDFATQFALKEIEKIEAEIKD